MINNAPSIRFIEDNQKDAAFNMAADQWLLMNCTGGSTIYIRFYTWSTPSITLGYMQKPEQELDLKSVQNEGVSWIRRLTGGRAVLHHEDITYSCIFPKTISLMGSTIEETYGIITKCLNSGLETLGIISSAQDSKDEFLALKREVKLPCFLAPNRNEVMVRGRKLVGSAQKRTNDAVLQHGSIPLTKAYRQLPRFLAITKEQQLLQISLLEKKSTCISECSPDISCKALLTALKSGFSTTLRAKSIGQNWTEQELQEIEDLAHTDPFVTR